MTETEMHIDTIEKLIPEIEMSMNLFSYDRSALQAALQALRRTAEYDKAQREGRLVLRPCKVGDVVFVTFRSHGILEIGVRKVTGFTDKAIEFPNQGFRLFTDFGKTVFFSRAEAEAALGDERDE